ncbi:hypothetical protein P0Y35_05965 [Kiritimatiellaeota bacterium B1221]|nr:hypothetical protein [Kiritimatiellaeota bacterium B1221]
MQLSSGTSKGVGKSIGLIGTGEGCAILLSYEKKSICPRREPLKGWSPACRTTTGLNQTYGSEPGTQVFLVPQLRKDGVGKSKRQHRANTENHMGD